MSVLNGVKNFLNLVFDNWTTIAVCGSMCYLIYARIKKFLSKSEDEKISFAKDLVGKTMLQYVSDAEKDYAEWVKAGSAKRAQVIARIYADFPVLAKVIDQDALIEWIDSLIKEALKEMRLMIAEKAE